VIERPKRSVTRFFIPLIDVLILLFCIFLLMPFMNEPGKAANGETPEPKDLTPAAMRKEMAGIRLELKRAQHEIVRLQGEQKDPTQQLSLFVLDIDPKNGNLFFYRNGKGVEVSDVRSAQRLIDDQKRQAAAGKKLFYVILLPRSDPGSGFPNLDQLDKYQTWFKDEPHRFDNPFGELTPGLEERK
jgi:hypothetical protein